ncbi:hypothetical protein V498_09960, partial [Pseudogymnoascus sp. VKM F-4517 (FW-2822)]
MAGDPPEPPGTTTPNPTPTPTPGSSTSPDSDLDLLARLNALRPTSVSLEHPR